MSDVRFRPIPVWPHPGTHPDSRRSRYTFKAGWSATLDLLDRESALLGAFDLVIGCGLREQDIRVDGWPRANAQKPSHPGVEISFSRRGGERLVYATDVCEFWQHNVRSIALGLEALRAVDRYGITRRGEQYAGFRAITSSMDVESQRARGERLIAEHGSLKAALRATHPDAGGNAVDFDAVTAVREGRA